MEILLTLPLLLLVAAGLVGLADLLVAEQLVGEAAARAARVAALGGDETEVQQVVAAVLGEHRASRARILIGSPEGTPSPPAPGQPLEVRVELRVRDATLTWLVPANPNELLIGRAVMLRE
ncbi:MAG: hypothetical protein RMJ88_09655 [Thermogemmata sp.]|nr:hypothetical protein [Thermogemmata sp.]